MKRIDLLMVDYQRDFVEPTGSLSIPGALDDAKRVAKMIKRVGKKFTNIHSSLDSHQLNQVFHTSFWLDKNNQHPNPFTPITHQQVKDGVYRTYKKSLNDWGLEYTEKLEAKGRYGLFLWPNHCLLYSEGWLLQKDVADSLFDWESTTGRNVNFLVKGNSPYSENYSIFQAEVSHPMDQSTSLNTEAIEIIQEADEIPIVGQAKSHCVAWTVKDLADNFGDDSYIKKLVFLEDASSSVPGFEQQGNDFVKEMMDRGMRISNTVDYLS